jgi:ribose transport system substrate-binding protein
MFINALKGSVSASALALLMASAFATFAIGAEPAPMRPAAWSDAKTDCKAMKKDPPWTIGVSNYSLANSFRVQMFEELKFAASKDSRIKDIVITNADGSVPKQLSDIQDLLTRHVNGLLITPLSAEAVAPTVEEAVGEGVPTVIFNNEIATDKFTSIVWADEYRFGWIGGDWLKEKLGGKGNVVVLEGIAGTSTSDLRTRGAIDALGAGVTILARQPADWAYDKGKKVMQDFISAYPRIDGVYSQGGAMSQAAIDALTTARKPLIPVTGEGYNGFLKVWAANKDKGFSSIGPDEPTWQSVEALNQLVACLSGNTVEKWHEIPISVITEKNLADFVKPACPDDVWANTKMDYATIKTLYKCSD